MLIIGEGMKRQCLPPCNLQYGCHQAATDADGHPVNVTRDCGDCQDGICPDTHLISHGLCQACLKIALAQNKARREPVFLRLQA